MNEGIASSKLPPITEIITVQDINDTVETSNRDKEEEGEIFEDAVNLASDGLNGC